MAVKVRSAGKAIDFERGIAGAIARCDVPANSMRLKRRVKGVLHNVGLDIIRYPLHDPLARTVKLLQHHRVACVVDVGANDGGFVAGIRDGGYSGRAVSFEPLAEPYEALRRKASADGNWKALQYAVGDTEADIEINVSGNAGLSSSVLPMLDTHSAAAPGSRYVRTETVRQVRLDDLSELDREEHTFLKIDVQGYERAVLDGASGFLSRPWVIGLQLELSLVPLYEGAMTYREGFDRADSLGMTLMGLDPVFADPNSGQLLQADAVFFKRDTLS